LILIGGTGNDNLRGSRLTDLLDGGAGNDILNGTNGEDTVLGGADADLLRVDAGTQRVEGGTGDDVLLFTSSAGLFTVLPNGHMVTVQGPQSRAAFAGSIEEINIREPSSSPLTKVIVGDLTDTGVTGVGISTGRSDVRTGYVENYAGEVEIHGRDVSDEIAVADADLHFVLTPLPTVTTAWGHVTIGDTDGFAGLTILGKGGDDSITVDPDASLGDTLVELDGGAGNDVLNADGTLLGGDGDDLLIGGAGDNLMEGGAGDDTFIGMGGNDTVDGGAGGDTILAEGTPASDVITVAETVPAVSMLVEDSNGSTVYLAPGGIGQASIERVLVEAGDGDDVINVMPLPNINIVVNAGGPSASDLMNVLVPGDATITQGADSTTGTVESGEGLGDIDYTGLENLSIQTAGEGALTGEPVDSNGRGRRPVDPPSDR
jgi:Ca2+-binding RTX toxin-like protein